MDVAESSSAASAATRSSRNGDSSSSFFFPPAAQPEVMRAAEKDEHYVASLCDACHEAFRHAMGVRLAVAYQNETKLAGRVLYYLLTTGSGLQTLGEEYCDISQVTMSTKLPATPARRSLLVFYQTVLPYVTERLRYHMIGMFLLIQLSIVGGDWLRRIVLPALALSMRSRVRGPSAAFSGKIPRCSMWIMRKAPPVGHMLVKGLDGRTLCLHFPSGDVVSGASVAGLLCARTGIPSHCFWLVAGTAVVRPDSFLASEDGRFPSCSLLLRLPGGTKSEDERIVEFQELDGGRTRKRKVEEDAIAKLWDEADPPRASKKPRFPKGKKDSGDRGVLQDPMIGEEDAGPILATDPRLAAKERALLRTVLNEELINAEDVSSADTVTAEERGAMGRLEDGITIEPFNLNQEREEGYFDGQGNYVEYRLNEDDKDAWFETAEVDESLQAKKFKEKEMAKEDTELTTEERWVLQKRIANTLLPGETILQAFRRLRGVTKDKKWAPPMVGETKQTFDRLTEDAMRLLDNGDYNIYHEDKETLQREADGYEALARARKGEPSGSNGTTQQFPQVQSTVGDMFADDDSFDMFGGDDNVPLSTTAGETSGNMRSQTEQISDTLPELPGYVYDANSGYYYNANDGYFYDKKSGLFCNAASGKWFMYDGANASYLEFTESGDAGASMSSVGAES